MPPSSLGFSASLDRLSGTLRVLSANREEGFELLRLALTAPRFDADMVEQRRAQTIAGAQPGRPAAGIGGAAHPDGDGVRRPSLCQRRLDGVRDDLQDAHACRQLKAAGEARC